MKHSHIIFIALLFLFSCKGNEGVKPVIKDIDELVFASGELQWESAYNIIAQTDGILQSLNIEEGNLISKNQMLGKIDNPTNTNNTSTALDQLQIANTNISSSAPALQQLQANIQFAENKYQQDKLQAERYQRLYQTQSIAKVEVENMQLNAKNSLSQLNALKQQYQSLLLQAKTQQINSANQVKNTQVQSYYNNIIAPQKGIVLKKNKVAGDYVKKGEVLATVGNNTVMEAVLSIDENSMGKIAVGQAVTIQLNAQKNKNCKAIITEIYPTFNTQTQSFTCIAHFTEPINFTIQGTQLEANILIGNKKNVLLIPRTAMGFGNKVNVKGKKLPVVIQPGIVSTEYVEVLSGITKDDILLPLKP